MAESEHNVKININGNEASAVGALSRVKSALHGIQNVAAGVTRALGWIHLAVNGVNMIVKAFTWMKDKITETAREMAKMRWDFQMRTAANETARLVGFHEKLAKLMKDELDTLAKQRSVADIETQGKKDAEDGKREADRARQIFEAKTPEEERALRDRFAAEDEQRERKERKDARQKRIAALDEEDSVYTSKARGLRHNNEQIDAQIADEEFNLKRAGGNKEDAEAIQKRIEALKKRKEANEAEIEQYEKEAKFRRDQIAALENQKDYDGPTAGEWQRKTEEKKEADRKAKEKADKAKTAQQSVEDARLERQKQEDIAALNPADKDYAAKVREIERTYEKRAAEDKVKRAETPEERQAAEEELEAVKIRHDRERREEAAGKLSDMEAFADRAASFDDVSQNRLTAMGLGSGVSATGGVASDVKNIVKLLEKEIEATKNIQPGEAQTATYGA